jgi:hypothetical protein
MKLIINIKGKFHISLAEIYFNFADIYSKLNLHDNAL